MSPRIRLLRAILAKLEPPSTQPQPAGEPRLLLTRQKGRALGMEPFDHNPGNPEAVAQRCTCSGHSIGTGEAHCTANRASTVTAGTRSMEIRDASRLVNDLQVKFASILPLILSLKTTKLARIRLK